MARLFAALVPPAEVRADLERFLEPRFDVPDWRWSSPDSWHVTLAFAGEVDAWHVDRVVEALGEVKGTPFGVRLDGGLTFPDAARAKLLGLRVVSDPSEALDHLARSVRHACAHAGAAVDGARFRGHLTLGRSNRPQDATKWLRVLDTMPSAVWRAEGFEVVESHLGEGPRGRPRHERLAMVHFGAPEHLSGQ